MSAKRDMKTVPLGSGNNYVAEFTTLPATPADIVALCKDENFAGHTTGGATFTYNATTHTEKDDLGFVQRTIITEEEAKLKLGIFIWDPSFLTKLVATGRSSVTEDQKYRVTKLGGIDNDNGKKYVVIFEHVDKVYGNLYVVLVGTNTAGLTLQFAKDSTSKLEPEFTAEPHDDKGTLIQIIEKLPETTPSQNSQGGSTGG